MCDRYYQADMPHALAAHFLLRYFYTASLARDTFIFNTLILTAGALIVFRGTENALAEQAIAFGLVGAVVNRFRLQNLATRLTQDFVRRSQTDGHFREAVLFIILFKCHFFKIKDSTKPDYSILKESARPWSSWRRTLNDSGKPGVGNASPLTMAS